jgi:hypothetical protein
MWAGSRDKAQPCATHNALVVGARYWHAGLDVDLLRHFGDVIDLATARHLAHTYGGNAVHVARLVAAQPALARGSPTRCRLSPPRCCTARGTSTRAPSRT